MKTEMDVMQFDERQRVCWLLASRATLIFVGLLWLGLIGWEFGQGHVPIFLIAMVPLVALVRFAFYRYYASRSKGSPANDE